MYKEGFAERIKKARKDANFTQKEVEEETGIYQPMIAFIENGKREPSIETLATLIDLYDVSADWILGTGKKRK